MSLCGCGAREAASWITPCLVCCVQESLLLALAADVASSPDTNVDQVLLACSELEASVRRPSGGQVAANQATPVLHAPRVACTRSHCIIERDATICASWGLVQQGSLPCRGLC